MQCLECDETLERLDNQHLVKCSGMTLQEYAIRHQLPLDMILHSDQINQPDSLDNYLRPVVRPSEAARQTLLGLRWAGLLRERDAYANVPGEIRRLDLLLWDLDQISDYGFRFQQDYEYSRDTHRVVAKNCLRAPLRNLRHEWATPEPPPAFLQALAVYVAHRAEWHAGYLFMEFNKAIFAEEVRQSLAQNFQVQCQVLDAADHPEGMLLRTSRLEDGEKLLALLKAHLQDMPTAWPRFYDVTPEATVSKELVFDAAHFITDHPAKCSNLHGGRYVLQVEVTGRIDPTTGCVVDYGYLKRVANRLIIERFDHHNLNYSAEELAWRSSTEMLCVYIWECLIEYLPGLSGLRLYETPNSWCDYSGRTLAEHQAMGSEPVLHPFKSIEDPTLRRRLLLTEPDMQVVASCKIN